MSNVLKLSCFSYKGGAGRSTLAMNIVPYLADALNATEERPLVLVDMDVDSCGITYFLNLHSFVTEAEKRFVVQRLFGSGGVVPQEDDEEISPKDHKLFSHLRGVGKYFNYPDRAILCLPAKQGASLGEAGTNYDNSVPPQLDTFLSECEEHDICCVLFDSAVGDQPTAKWSNHYADKILCCLRPTEQFREGTSRFFDTFDEKSGRHKSIIVIPNVVPTDPLIIQEEEGEMQYPSHAKDEIIKAFKPKIERGLNNYDMSMLEGDCFGVPKIDRFMWHESVLRTASDLKDSEREALQSYKKIVDIILGKNNG